MTVAVLPEVGSRWRHRRNKRFVLVKDIVASGGRDDDLQIMIGYIYLRSSGVGVGWRRGVAPRQDMIWTNWNQTFVEAPK